jgi:2-haloacid dehalogenase
VIRPRLVTFDFYTALVDCTSTIASAVSAVMGERVDARAFARAWRTRQLEWAQWSNSLQRGRIPFRECTRRALVSTLQQEGVPLNAAQSDELVAAWDRLEPWPEADASLAAIRSRGYPIAVLSNGDEAMLRSGVVAFDVSFDHVFASDRAGAYKPHPAMYALPSHALGIDPADVLHVAGSGVDAMGAKLAGLRCVWSNRRGEPGVDDAVTPDAQIRDLSGLVALLEA